MTASRLRVLRADDHVRMAWANGGGTTYQVLVSPEGAGPDEFDWRISLADVESSGPFSCFPGIERILVLLEGEGMELVVDGRVVPLARHDPLRFDGGADTSCTLAAGPTKDLNVMTRQGRCRADVDVVSVDGEHALAPGDGTTVLVLVLDGQVRADEVRLWSRDLAVVDRPVVLRGTAVLGVVTVGAAPSGHG